MWKFAELFSSVSLIFCISPTVNECSVGNSPLKWYLSFFFSFEITLIYGIICFTSTLYFNFCLHYIMLTTKWFLFVTILLTPPFTLLTSILLSVSMCLFLFGLAGSFIHLLILIFCAWVISYSLFFSDLFHLVYIFKVHPYCCQLHNFIFSWLRSISLCVCL